MAQKSFNQLLKELKACKDITPVVKSQKSTLLRYEEVNEMLRQFLELSNSTHTMLLENYMGHTKTLINLKRDLEVSFRRIRSLKNRLKEEYPNAFEATSAAIRELEDKNKQFQEEDDDIWAQQADDKISSTDKHATSIRVDDGLAPIYDGDTVQSDACNTSTYDGEIVKSDACNSRINKNETSSNASIGDQIDSSNANNVPTVSLFTSDQENMTNDNSTSLNSQLTTNTTYVETIILPNINDDSTITINNDKDNKNETNTTSNNFTLSNKDFIPDLESTSKSPGNE